MASCPARRPEEAEHKRLLQRTSTYLVCHRPHLKSGSMLNRKMLKKESTVKDPLANGCVLVLPVHCHRKPHRAINRQQMPGSDTAM